MPALPPPPPLHFAGRALRQCWQLRELTLTAVHSMDLSELPESLVSLMIQVGGGSSGGGFGGVSGRFRGGSGGFWRGSGGVLEGFLGPGSPALPSKAAGSPPLSACAASEPRACLPAGPEQEVACLLAASPWLQDPEYQHPLTQDHRDRCRLALPRELPPGRPVRELKLHFGETPPSEGGNRLAPVVGLDQLLGGE